MKAPYSTNFLPTPCYSLGCGRESELGSRWCPDHDATNYVPGHSHCIEPGCGEKVKLGRIRCKECTKTYCVVCPTCGGGRTPCETCSGLGMISKAKESELCV